MSWREKSYEVLPALTVRGRNLRQSLRLVTIAWMWGVVWATCVNGDQMRAYAKMLGFNDFAFGLMAAIPYLATLSQLPAAIIVERAGLRKYFFLYCQLAARFLWFPIALVPFVFHPGAEGSVLAVIVALMLLAVTNLLAHLATPPWFTWMGDLVPRRIRGRYFARRSQLATIIQIVVIVGISILLDHVRRSGEENALNQPQLLVTICSIFAIGAIFGIMDILMFARIREIYPPRHEDAKPSFSFDVPGPSEPSFAGRLGYVLRFSWKVAYEVLLDPLRDRIFRNYVCYGACLTFSMTVGGWYYWVHSKEVLGFNTLAANCLFMAVGPLTGMLTSSWWGRLIDRWGRRPVLILSTLGTILSTVPWFIATRNTPSPQFLVDAVNWVSSALGGLLGFDGYHLISEGGRRVAGAYCLAMLSCIIGGSSWWGLGLAQSAIILGFSDGKGRNKFVAASSVLINIGGVLGGVVGGIVAESCKDVIVFLWNNYQITFALSIFARLIGMLFLRNMPDPGSRRVRDLIRHWGQIVFNNIRSPFRPPNGTSRCAMGAAPVERSQATKA